MNLDHLEAVARKATRGPWHHRKDGRADLNNQRDLIESDEPSTCKYTGEVSPTLISYGMPTGANAIYVAAFSPDVALAMVAVCRAAGKYYVGYAQDEAADGEYADAGKDGPYTGCSNQQARDALALREALTALALVHSDAGRPAGDNK